MPPLRGFRPTRQQSWTAAVLRRFFTRDDPAKAPEHWRSPKPRGMGPIENKTQSMSYTAKILSQDISSFTAYHEIRKAIWENKIPQADRSYERLWERLNCLSAGERGFIVTNDFQGEMDCNGFNGYFMNTECRQAHETEQALRLFGLEKAADFLKRAIAIAGIPEKLPPDYSYRFTEESDKALQTLDSEYSRSKADCGFEEAVIAYVRRHHEQFV